MKQKFWKSKDAFVLRVGGASLSKRWIQRFSQILSSWLIRSPSEIPNPRSDGRVKAPGSLPRHWKSRVRGETAEGRESFGRARVQFAGESKDQRRIDRSPNRDQQFQHINEQVRDFQHRQEPVIPVDTKKKELVGEFKMEGTSDNRKGAQWRSTVMTFLTRLWGRRTTMACTTRMPMLAG